MLHRRWWAFVACTVVSGPPTHGWGQTAAPTLHDVVATALHANLDVVTARLRGDSAHAEVRIARSFTNPSASVSPGVPFEYGLSTELDVGPNRHYRVKAAHEGLQAARLNLADTERQVVFSVREAFYDLLLADALAALAIDEQGILAQVLAADSARLRSGAAAEAAVVTSELNFARAEAAVAKAQATVRASRLALQQLMGVSAPDTGFRVTGTLRFDTVDVPLDRPDTLLAIADQTRPDVKSADEQLAQSRSIRQQANWLLLPIPSIGLTYQPDVNFQSPGLKPTTVIGGSGSHVALSFSVPLPVWNWFGGERERATAGVAVARAADQRTRLALVTEVTRTADSLRSATLLAARYQGGLLTKTEAAVETARYAYARGAISLLELLDAIRTNADIRTEYYTAIHDYWVAAYALDRAIGRDLVPD